MQFLSEHAELMDADWWIALQERLRRGEQPEVLPYGPERRLRPEAVNAPVAGGPAERGSNGP